MKFVKPESKPAAKPKPVKIPAKAKPEEKPEPKKVRRKTRVTQVATDTPLYEFLMNGIKLVDETPTWDNGYHFRSDVPLLLTDDEGTEHKVSDNRGMAIRSIRRGLFLTESSGAHGQPIQKALQTFVDALEGMGVYITGHIHASGQPVDKATRKRALDKAVEREQDALHATLEKEKAKQKKQKAKEIDESMDEDLLVLDDEPEPKPKSKPKPIKVRTRSK